MMALPTGLVTFMFTDIEGSTRLHESDPETYAAALARHDAILEAAIAMHGGMVFMRAGDSFSVAFSDPSAALRAAFDAQRALQHERWLPGASIAVRMGLHTGQAEVRGGQYFGLALNRSARLMSSAHGGQAILSAVTASLVREALPDGARLTHLGEHRLRDLSQPEQVYQIDGPGLTDTFPPLRTLSSRPNNLPIQATPFIGREQQLQRVRALLLRPETRLLTLTGPGGTGKTRLALQLAADVVDSFADGVFFVPLASVVDPELVAPAVAQALDVREAPGRPVIDSLRAFLRTKELLLVLDNFEQVVGAAPAVADLLATAASVRIVVTSRAVLRLYGEREYPVPPLAMPDRRSSPTAAHLAQFEAVRLFVDRAQTARPDFVLTNENAADVAQICQRLDGLPLTLELAAARIRSLTPRAMLQRMEHSLPLLTGGARDLPARQRTLRGAIAWSYDLLEPAEQVLFRRLGILRGCTLEEAESVCAGEPPRPGSTSVALPPLDLEVLDGLESLAEKSLIRQEQTVDGLPWYVMLETIREYARERLDESGETLALQRRVILAATKLAEAAEYELYGAHQGTWLPRLEQEHDNLRSALSWCQEHGYAQPAFRLSVALWWFWSARGHLREGRERLAALLHRFPATPTSRHAGLRAKALQAAGTLATIQNDFVVARELHEEQLTLSRVLGDPVAELGALQGLGNAASQQGDHLAARRYLEAGVAIARELGDGEHLAASLHHLASAVNELGDFRMANAHFTESLAINRSLSKLVPYAQTLLTYGVALQQQDDLDAAEAALNEALSIWQDAGDPRSTGLALANLGSIALARGDLALARDRLSQSVMMQREIDDLAGVALALERFVGLVAAEGRPEDAILLAGAASGLRDLAGAPLTASGESKLDEILDPASATLGQSAAVAAWHAGRALTLEQAVEAAVASAPATPVTAPAAVSQAGRPTPTATSSVMSATVLTRREREVARLITQGLTNRQIAEQLVITEGTAASHVVHILNKLGFNSRAQVAAWAVEAGVMTGDAPA